MDTSGRAPGAVADAVVAALAAASASAAPRPVREEGAGVKRLTVRAESRTYPILVGRDVLGRLGGEVRRLRGDGQVVVLCDENVAPLYLEQARDEPARGRPQHLARDPARGRA